MDFNTIFNSLGAWTLGSFVIIDLIAATTNAFNGAILASRPDHHRKWTVVGIVLIAVIGGIGGGVTRDVLLNDLPSALTNPWYVILCLLAGALALTVIRGRTPESVARIFDFMAAFSLPWYAIIGTQKALGEHLGLLAVVLIGVVGPTAGRYFIDITSRVTPQHFVRGNWFVGTAALASVLYIIFDALLNRLSPGISIWYATLIAWAICFVFRLLALRYNWQEPEPWDQNAAEREQAPAAD